MARSNRILTRMNKIYKEIKDEITIDDIEYMRSLYPCSGIEDKRNNQVLNMLWGVEQMHRVFWEPDLFNK